MLSVKRVIAVAGLLILGITELAPHRHGDSIDDSNTATEVHVLRCDGPTAGVAHMHRDQQRSSNSTSRTLSLEPSTCHLPTFMSKP